MPGATQVSCSGLRQGDDRADVGAAARRRRAGLPRGVLPRRAGPAKRRARRVGGLFVLAVSATAPGPPQRGRQAAWMLDACLPFGPWVTSKLTFWPSFRVLKPGMLIAEKCANRSSPPSSGVMNPNPFASLNHLTVPVAIVLRPYRMNGMFSFGQQGLPAADASGRARADRNSRHFGAKHRFCTRRGGRRQAAGPGHFCRPLEKSVAIIKHRSLRPRHSPSRKMANQQQDGRILEAEKTRLKPPPLYKVLLLNDDYTPMDFVVVVLQTVFAHEPGEGDAGDAAGPPRGDGGLRHLHAGSGGGEGGAGDRHRPQAPAPAAVHDGGDLSVMAGRARGRRTRGVTEVAARGRDDDRAGTGSLPPHGLRRGEAEAARVHHRRAPAARDAGQSVGGRGAEGLRRRPRGAARRAHRLHQRAHAAAVAAFGFRHPADAGLPARDPARDPARPVVGQEGGHRRQRAGRDLRREGVARRLLPQPARRDPPRRRQLHRARHRQGRAAEAGQGGGARKRPRAGASAGRARRVHDQPQPDGQDRQDRPADRPRRWSSSA